MIVKPISDISYFTEEFGHIDGPLSLNVNWHSKQSTDQFNTATTFVAQYYDCVVHSTPPLLVTKDKVIAERFVKTMHSGVPEYFCNVKSSKTKISFECHLNEKDVTKIHDGGRLAWCGLLIDTGSYEILGDYEKYEQVQLKYAISSVFTGVELVKKVRAFLKPKCHALLFDGDLNSPKVVRLNAFHMYLVAAIKFHILVILLIENRRLKCLK